MEFKNTIDINTRKKSVIYFCSFEKISEKIKYFNINKDIIIIYDYNLKPSLLKLKDVLIKEGYNIHCLKIEAKEKYKNFEVASKLIQTIISFNIKKNTAIISLGGGITGDITAFCSSIIMRGIKLFHIPTTFLSQVDSAIGGKNGVNTIIGKNTLGTIYQPDAIFIDHNFLKTLSYRDFISGYAECLKYGLVYDEDFFKFLDDNKENIRNKNYDDKFIEYIIYKSCLYKKMVVEADELETKNIRYFLNFGHTFAHALEAYNNYKDNLTHGEAVFIGMTIAFDFAYYIDICSEKDVIKLKQHLNLLNINYKLDKIVNDLDINKFITLMQQDKKNINYNINLILPSAIGKCILKTDITVNQLKKFFHQYN